DAPRQVADAASTMETPPVQRTSGPETAPEHQALRAQVRRAPLHEATPPPAAPDASYQDASYQDASYQEMVQREAWRDTETAHHPDMAASGETTPDRIAQRFPGDENVSPVESTTELAATSRVTQSPEARHVAIQPESGQKTPEIPSTTVMQAPSDSSESTSEATGERETSRPVASQAPLDREPSAITTSPAEAAPLQRSSLPASPTQARPERPHPPGPTPPKTTLETTIVESATHDAPARPITEPPTAGAPTLLTAVQRETESLPQPPQGRGTTQAPESAGPGAPARPTMTPDIARDVAFPAAPFPNAPIPQPSRSRDMIARDVIPETPAPQPHMAEQDEPAMPGAIDAALVQRLAARAGPQWPSRASSGVPTTNLDTAARARDEGTPSEDETAALQGKAEPPPGRVGSPAIDYSVTTLQRSPAPQRQASKPAKRFSAPPTPPAAEISTGYRAPEPISAFPLAMPAPVQREREIESVQPPVKPFTVQRAAAEKSPEADSKAETELDLEDLARQILPRVKRLLRTEFERRSSKRHEL
ncbi:MAG: hypothetical protein JXB35_14970, partial [Anaerolineae bacterium]|nr:hypothetical protein [Anaerolineae bacterium]